MIPDRVNGQTPSGGAVPTGTAELIGLTGATGPTRTLAPRETAGCTGTPERPVPRSASPEPPSPPRPGGATGKPAPTLGEAVAQQLGGVRGLVESSAPVVVFVVVNLLTQLRPALWASIGTAALIAVTRLSRRESVRHAVNGLLGVGIAAMLAARTGRAEDFYLPGILMNFLYGVGFAVSVALRRPLVGYAWTLVTGDHPDWRRHPRLVRVFGLLSLLWTGVFVLRGAVQLVLYILRQPHALGLVRIAGIGLYAAALAVTVWYGRRALRSAESA